MKLPTSLSRALVKCLIKPSLKCSGGKSILSLCSRGLLLIIVALQGTYSFPTGQSFSYNAKRCSTIPQKVWGLGEPGQFFQQKFTMVRSTQVEWARNTEGNWLSSSIRRFFIDRLLLSVNRLQFLDSYYGTPILCRSCEISVEYSKSSCLEKDGGIFMHVAVEDEPSTIQEGALSLQLECSLAEDFDKMRSRNRSFSFLW